MTCHHGNILCIISYEDCLFRHWESFPGQQLSGPFFTFYLHRRYSRFNRPTLSSLVFRVPTSCTQLELCQRRSFDLSLAIVEARKQIKCELFKLIMPSLRAEADGIVQHVCQLFRSIFRLMQLFNLCLILCCKNIHILQMILSTLMLRDLKCKSNNLLLKLS